MGLLERLLQAQTPAGVASLNGAVSALTVAAVSPLKLTQVGAVFTLTLDPAGAQRGSLIHKFSGGFGPLNAGTLGHFLRSNGPGSDLTWAAPPIVSDPPALGRYVLTSNAGVGAWSKDVDVEDGNFIQDADEGAYRIRNGAGTFDVFKSDGADLFIGETSATGPSHVVTLRGATEVRLGAGIGGAFRSQLIAQPDYVRVNAFGTPTNPNAGGRGVFVLADAEVEPTGTPTGAVALHAKAGRLRSREAGGVVRHVVSAWGALTSSGSRFLSSTSGATFTGVAVQTRTQEIDGTTVQVVCLT